MSVQRPPESQLASVLAVGQCAVGALKLTDDSRDAYDFMYVPARNHPEAKTKPAAEAPARAEDSKAT